MKKHDSELFEKMHIAGKLASRTLDELTSFVKPGVTTDFLDKSTWTLATIMLVLILLSNVAINRGSGDAESKAIDDINTEQPVVPAATPAQTENTGVANDSAQ